METYIQVSHSEIVKAFSEWDRRYREDPSKFMNEVQHLLKETPESYGDQAAIYFEKVLKDNGIYNETRLPSPPPPPPKRVITEGEKP